MREKREGRSAVNLLKGAIAGLNIRRVGCRDDAPLELYDLFGSHSRTTAFELERLFGRNPTARYLAELQQYKAALEWLEKEGADSLTIGVVIDGSFLSREALPATEVLQTLLTRKLRDEHLDNVAEAAIEHCRREIERLRKLLKEEVEKL